MAGKADFTEAEWEQLHQGVNGSGMLVSLSDRGFWDTFKETGALAKHVSQARTSESALVRELAATKGTGFGVTTKPEELAAGTFAALKASVTTLQAKAPDDLEAYRAFVLDVAQAVADAAKGGDEAEAKAIEGIKAALA